MNLPNECRDSSHDGEEVIGLKSEIEASHTSMTKRNPVGIDDDITKKMIDIKRMSTRPER